MKVIVKVRYANANCRDRIDYNTRFYRELYDQEGNVMDKEKEKEFVDRSRKFEYHQDIMLSFEEKQTRENMQRFAERYTDEHLQNSGRVYTTDYAYVIHDEGRNHHVHVTLTGEEQELKIKKNTGEAKEMVTDANILYQKMEQEHEHNIEKDIGMEKEFEHSGDISRMESEHMYREEIQRREEIEEQQKYMDREMSL